MIKIIPLDLIGYKSLDYDLYDDKGEIVYRQGDDLTPDLLIMFNFKKIYKKAEQGIIIEIPTAKIAPSIISDKTAEQLLTTTRTILKTVFDGETPDISSCVSARDLIVEEIATKLEKVNCIAQLRVFDEYTFSHTVNVSTLTTAIAISLNLPEKDIQDLAMGALLHDIGKMRIPKGILNKPGKLTSEEFEVIKKHTTFGYDIVLNEMDLGEKVAKVALEHQERFVGGGYPNGLEGSEISLWGQITAIADVYDALVSKRVYKHAMASSDAIRIMLSECNGSFNPILLYKFIYLANYRDSSKIISENEAPGEKEVKE